MFKFTAKLAIMQIHWDEYSPKSKIISKEPNIDLMNIGHSFQDRVSVVDDSKDNSKLICYLYN